MLSRSSVTVSRYKSNVSTLYYLCVHIQNYMCPHPTTYVPSSCCICVIALLCVSAYCYIYGNLVLGADSLLQQAVVAESSSAVRIALLRRSALSVRPHILVAEGLIL